MTEAGAMKRQWSVREYQEGDEEQILELWGIVFGGSKDNQWWKWQYLDSPAGAAIIWLAEAKQKIVGHNARVPVRMKIGNETRTGAHGSDLMTHPDYQRQGIRTTLSNRGIESAVKNGFAINYGTPNEQSYHGAVTRLQSFEICRVPDLVKVVDWGTILKRKLGIPTIIGNLLGHAYEFIISLASRSQNAGIETEQILSFDERIDRFWLRASEIKSIMVVKDMKHLNWRYVDKPGNEYEIFIAKKHEEIVGYAVLKFDRDDLTKGYIMDLLTLPNEDIAAQVLITKAVEFLQEEGATTVSCLMLREAPYYRTLRKLGFIRRPSGYRLCSRIYDPRIPKEFVADPNNWYYVRGDGDVY